MSVVHAKGKGYVAGGRDGIYFRELLAPSEQGPKGAPSGPGLLWPILTIAAGLLVALAILERCEWCSALIALSSWISRR